MRSIEKWGDGLIVAGILNLVMGAGEIFSAYVLEIPLELQMAAFVLAVFGFFRIRDKQRDQN